MQATIGTYTITLKDSLVVRDFIEIEKIKNRKVDGETPGDTEISIAVTAHLTSDINGTTDKNEIKILIENMSLTDFTELSQLITQVIKPEDLKKNLMTSSTPTPS
jgi:hypothetical protein